MRKLGLILAIPPAAVVKGAILQVAVLVVVLAAVLIAVAAVDLLAATAAVAAAAAASPATATAAVPVEDSAATVAAILIGRAGGVAERTGVERRVFTRRRKLKPLRSRSVNIEKPGGLKAPKGELFLKR